MYQSRGRGLNRYAVSASRLLRRSEREIARLEALQIEAGQLRGLRLADPNLQVSGLAISLPRSTRFRLAIALPRFAGLRPRDFPVGGLRPTDRSRAITRPESCRFQSAGFSSLICKLQPRDCSAPICRPQNSQFLCFDPRDRQGNPRPKALRCLCPVLQVQVSNSF